MSIAKLLKFNTAKNDNEGDQRRLLLEEAVTKTFRPLQHCRKNSIELSGLNDVLDHIQKEQNKHLDSFAAAFNELASSAEEISTTNQLVLTQAENSLFNVEEGVRCVQQLKNVTEQLSSYQKDFQNLLGIMKSIHEATVLINNIVFQTKMLSFNATIEAARAGEHGKGFSVVANEVKKLAEESKEASDTVAEKINTAISTVEGLVKSLSTGIGDLVEYSDVTSMKFDNIKNNVTTLTSSVREITVGVENQTVAINQNLMTLEEFTRLSQKNGRFSVLSVQEISNDVSKATEDIANYIDQSRLHLNLSYTNDQEFWNEIDKTLLQIVKKKDLESSLQAVVTTISSLTKWKIGHVLLPNREGLTVSSGIWNVMDAGFKQSEFFSMSTKAKFECGKGLPGRVYKSKHFEYIEDVVVDTNFPRAKAAEVLHLVSGIGVPILTRDKEVVAVIEFFAYEHIVPDDNLVEALTQMGEVIGAKSI